MQLHQLAKSVTRRPARLVTLPSDAAVYSPHVKNYIIVNVRAVFVRGSWG